MMLNSPPIAAYAPTDDTPEAVEGRVRLLEETVANLQQDAAKLEDRVVEKVAERLSQSRAKKLRESASTIIDAGKSLIPKAAGTGPDSAPWVLFELIGELRVFHAMFFDRSFSFTTLGRFGPVVLLTLYVVGWFSIAMIPWVGWILQRLYEAVLIVLLYKLMRREGARYRQYLESR